MKKRFLSSILAIMMALSLLPGTAFAAEGAIEITETSNILESGNYILNRDVTLTTENPDVENDPGSGQLQVPQGAVVTIDLNGHTLTCTYDGVGIWNNGTLTINDSSAGKTGVVYNNNKTYPQGFGHDAVRNWGTLIVNGGTFGDQDTDRTNANDTNYAAAIRNHGTAYINGGFFTCVDNYGQWSEVPAGGSGSAYSYAIRNFASMTINNATVYGAMNGGIAADGGTITINDGTFGVTGSKSFHVLTTNKANEGSVIINGGRFEKSGNDYYLLSGFAGMPSWDASANLSENGYILNGGVFVKDGITVDMMPAAQIGEIQYGTLAAAITSATAGQTVKLLKPCTVSEQIRVDKSITLDLNGQVITNALNGVRNSEEDDLYKGRMLIVTNGASLTVDGTSAHSGMTIGSGANTVGFIGVDVGSALTLNGGSYTGDTAKYYYNEYQQNYPGSFVFMFDCNNSEDANTGITMNNVTATSNHSILNGDTIFGNLAVNVTGGTYTADADFLFHTDTMKLCPVNFKDVTATCTGTQPVIELTGSAGTFDNCTFEEIQPNDNNFSDSAIFVGYNGSADVKSGTYKSAGTALYIGSTGGTIRVEGGTFSGGKHAAVANAGADCESAIEIMGGSFTGELTASGSGTTEISISGGYFTSDPGAYVTDAARAAIPGSYVVDGIPYAYQVTAKPSLNVDTAVSAGDPAVVPAPPEAPQPVKDAADAIAGTTAQGMGSEASEKINDVQPEAVEKAIEDLDDKLGGNGAATTDNVTLVIEPSLAIEIKDAAAQTVDQQETITSVTLDIQAQYNIKATTGDPTQPGAMTDDNTVQLNEKPLPLTVTEPVIIKAQLPANFIAGDGATVYVKHIKGPGETYVYPGIVSVESGKKFVTFTNPHGFSEFEIGVEPAAKIGGTYYSTLHEAVNALTGGETITLLKNTTETITIGKSLTFAIAPNGHTYTEFVTGANTTVNRDTSTPGTVRYTFKYTAPSGDSSVTTYAVTIEKSENGVVTSNVSTAAKGAAVTLTVTPGEGFALDTLTVLDADGKEVALAEKDGKYTFTMPRSQVTVSASFKAAAPAELPFTDVPAGAWYEEGVRFAYEKGLFVHSCGLKMASSLTAART